VWTVNDVFGLIGILGIDIDIDPWVFRLVCIQIGNKYFDIYPQYIYLCTQTSLTVRIVLYTLLKVRTVCTLISNAVTIVKTTFFHVIQHIA
jgi:hypothetical protein